MILGAMRVVKYFCYEQPFLKRKSDYSRCVDLDSKTPGIFEIRHEELKGTKKIQVARSAK